MDSIKTFSERLNKLRKENSVTVYELADYLGVKEPSVMCYLSSRNYPTVANLMKISDLFDVSLDYLVGRTDEPEINKKSETSGRREKSLNHE
jgi:transcriptional regulator with XRE-family HTH domain